MDGFPDFLNRNSGKFFWDLVSLKKVVSFWVCFSPKATFTLRYVQAYTFTFLLIPPNKWCLPQFTVVQLVIWSGTSHVALDNREKPGNAELSDHKRNPRQSSLSLFFFYSSASISAMHFVLRHAGRIHVRAIGLTQKKVCRLSYNLLFLVGLDSKSANMRERHSTSVGDGCTAMNECTVPKGPRHCPMSDKVQKSL